MSIRANSKGVITVVFVLITAFSFSYIALSALNYMQYWPGVSALSSELKAFGVQTEQSSQLVTVVSTVEVRNPSDYSGFSLSIIQLRVYFFAGNESNALFQTQSLNGGLTVSQPLSPRSSVAENIIIELTHDQSSSFLTFNQTYSGRVTAHVVVHAEVDSFLNRVAGKTLFDLPVNRTLS